VDKKFLSSPNPAFYLAGNGGYHPALGLRKRWTIPLVPHVPSSSNGLRSTGTYLPKGMGDKMIDITEKTGNIAGAQASICLASISKDYFAFIGFFICWFNTLS
jgi:hypothetical protein